MDSKPNELFTLHFNLIMALYAYDNPCASIQVFKKLTTLFKALGVKAVFDTSCSRDLTLIESCYEFITRYRQCHSTTDKKSKLGLPLISSACPGIPNILFLIDFYSCYQPRNLDIYSFTEDLHVNSF